MVHQIFLTGRWEVAAESALYSSPGFASTHTTRPMKVRGDFWGSHPLLVKAFLLPWALLSLLTPHWESGANEVFY